ncbi:SRPBCC family protein [Leptospira sarikeiensis]|uniref:SRPBCC family protein n=1 Tax=Leptospira sarikeiensis TaxID=2484943 RepID=A0A4R9K3S5_9LEPT|nr:SRPBCC family protein [Leptospira sarikeiensis]TGL58907.1 SRPBCC family protein [Leptospira sarikeiensis]
MNTRHISITIPLPKEKVYQYLSNPENFPEWASGLCKSITALENGEWSIDSPMGQLTAKFTETNPFGILDHYVIFNPDKISYNPLRIIDNGEGSELIFTLFQTEDMSAEKFEEDAKWVRKDLLELKNILIEKFKT